MGIRKRRKYENKANSELNGTLVGTYIEDNSREELINALYKMNEKINSR